MTAIPFIGAVAQQFDNNGSALAFGSVAFYQAGTTNVPLATYANFGKTIVNPVIMNLNAAGQFQNDVWGDGGYHIFIYDAPNGGGNLVHDRDNFFLSQTTGIPFVVLSGSPNAYIGSPNPSVSSYSNGDTYNVLWPFTNTGPSTINLSNVGVVDLLDPSGGPLVRGENLIGTIGTIIFNNGSFVVSNPQDATEIPVYNLTGTANNYVLTPSPALADYTSPVLYTAIANFTNTGAATLDTSAHGALPIKYPDGSTALVGGEIVNGQTYQFAIETTKVILLNPTPIKETVYTTGGTSNAYTLTPTPPMLDYNVGTSFWFTPHTANAASATMNISGRGVKSLNSNNLGILPNQLLLNHDYQIIYNGTTLDVVNPTVYTNPTPAAGIAGSIPVVATSHDQYSLLSQGTSGQLLTSNGADALPSFNTAYLPPTPAGGSVGSIVVENASANGYSLLGQGSSGQLLTSAGANANPAWSTVYANPTPAGSGYGSLVMENSSSNGYSLLTPGTSGQFLKSNGSNAALTYATPNENWNLIQTQTPSGASSVSFTSGIDSTYVNYRIFMALTSGSLESVQFYINSSLVTSNDYSYRQIRNGTNSATPSTTGINIGSMDMGYIDFSYPSVSAVHAISVFGYNEAGTTATINLQQTIGGNSNSGVLTGLLIGGTSLTGTFTLYGIK